MSSLAEKLTRLPAVALLALLCLGCRQEAGSGNTAASAGKILRGGDRQAWLTDLGDLSGNCYCQDQLKLPLNREPQWEFTYTPAEFSNQRIYQILHYDGLLAICARGPQIALLDTNTGGLVANQDVYQRIDVGQDRELFDTLTFSEDGRLFALDDVGRYYSWAVSRQGLKRLWLGPPVKYGRAGLLATRGEFISGGDDVIYTAKLEDGERSWLYPAPQTNEGIVCSRDGKAVCWTSLNQVSCLDMENGSSLWSCAVPSNLERCTINEALGCVYIGRQDETLECRSMVDGSLLWSHDWSNLISREERKQRANAVNRRNITLPLWAVCADERGVALQMASGDVQFLDLDGTVVWERKLGTAAAAGLLFPNALIVMQFYFRADLRGRPSIFDPFNLEQPQWQIIKDTLALARSSTGSDSDAVTRAESELYVHLAVLDPASGKELDYFEPEVLPLCGLTPAFDYIVFGGTQKISDEVLRRKGTTPVRRVRAYQWLEPEAK